jgi:hypothetical protein
MVDIVVTLESETWWSRRNGEHFSNIGVGETVHILATLESEKWWSRRNGGHFSNIGVGEMVSKKWWTFSNVGVGEMVDCRRSRINGGT